MATIIRVDGTFEHLEGEGPNGTVTYEQLRQAVGGDIEMLPIVDDEGFGEEHPTHRMYINAEGMPEANNPAYPGLPINRMAGRLNGPRAHPVWGDVVYCRIAGEYGDDDI